MKKLLINLITSFIPSKKIRKKIRAKFKNSNYNDEPKISYAQFGEDIIVEIILLYLFNKNSNNIKYLDIGSNYPHKVNNTYYFYKRKGQGVLVEPNPYFKKTTNKLRPRDVFLNCGIACPIFEFI